MAPTGMLSGKTVLITGASRGVGEAVALTYAKEGATLILAARSLENLQATAEKCKVEGSPQVHVFEVDLSMPSDVQHLADDVLANHGGVDVLVNNAGTGGRGTALDGSPDDWEVMFSINVHAPMRLTRMFAPRMVEKENGVIINVCSIAALEGMKGSGAYAATKHAIRGWSVSCYESLRASNVKVMAIHPAGINTDMVAGNPKWDYGRLIQPSDVAEVAMLPFRTSAGCCPQEVTLRLTRPAVV